MSVRHLELADFRIFRAAHARPRSRGDHGHHRIERHRQDQRARGARLPRDPAVLPRRAARGHGAHGGRERHRAGRARRGATAPPWSRREILPAGRSRTRVNRKAVSGPQGARRRRPVHDLLARGPGHRQRRPQGPARAARRRAGPARRRRGPGGRRDRPGPAPAGRAAAPVGRPGRRGGHGDPRRVGPAAGRRRQGAGGGPRTAGGGPRAPGGRRPTATWPGPGSAGPDRQRYVRSWDGRPARRAGRLAGATTCGGASTRWARTATTCSSRSTGREARTHASQGEQRCLALALRLGVHRLVRARTDAASRPCCSTTSSPSSTRPAAGPWWPSCRPASRS